MPATATLPPAEMTSDAFTDADAPQIAAQGQETAFTADAAPSETFTPDTADKVDWVLKQIATARADADRIRANGEAMAKQADAEAERLLFLFGPALQAFARREIEGTRRRSVRLFHGHLGFKTKPAALTVSDEGAALAWAKENAPAAVSVKVDRRALADALTLTDAGAVDTQTGEVLAWAGVTLAEDVFFVR